VTELSERLADFAEFLKFFRNKIQPDGTLEDNASFRVIADSPRNRKAAACHSGIAARAICGASPKAEPCRTN